jgi:ribonuclease Z
MHGDHVFGLPGLLLTIQMANITAYEKRDLEIYGPVGLYNYISTALSLTNSDIRTMNVHIYELMGGTMRSMRNGGNRKQFHDFHHKRLHRKSLPQNEDGTWTLSQPFEITTPELALKHSSTPSGLYIKAAEIHHVPQLQCFGYTFEEPKTLPLRIDMDKVRASDITLKKDHFKLLKARFPVELDGRQVRPEDFCVDVYARRKVTVLGDCCLVPPIMEQIARNSDILVHEATLTELDQGAKALVGGHSTAGQAAVLANKIQAKVLILNHLSKKTDKYAGMKAVHSEAMARILSPTAEVQLAFDHIEVMIPREGYQFEGLSSDVDEPLGGLKDETVNVDPLPQLDASLKASGDEEK